MENEIAKEACTIVKRVLTTGKFIEDVMENVNAFEEAAMENEIAKEAFTIAKEVLTIGKFIKDVMEGVMGAKKLRHLN